MTQPSNRIRASALACTEALVVSQNTLWPDLVHPCGLIVLVPLSSPWNEIHVFVYEILLLTDSAALLLCRAAGLLTVFTLVISELIKYPRE
jgi:hypothetical protein